MNSLMSKIRGALGQDAIVKDERGLSTVEYVVLLVLIVAASVGLWVSFGGALTAKLGNVNSEMGKVTFTPGK